jgi:hypothetical protein
MNEPMHANRISTGIDTFLVHSFRRFALISFCLLAFMASAEDAESREFKCSKNVVACVQIAHRKCPKNVTFIGDHDTDLGFKVFPKGLPVTAKTTKNRPMLVICTPK